MWIELKLFVLQDVDNTDYNQYNLQQQQQHQHHQSNNVEEDPTARAERQALHQLDKAKVKWEVELNKNWSHHSLIFLFS